MTSSVGTPTDLQHNQGLIVDPRSVVQETGAASWLFLCGEEFAQMDGGTSRAADERLACAQADNAFFTAETHRTSARPISPVLRHDG